MSTDAFRSGITNLNFQLYTRSLHPELFETVMVRRVVREDFALTVRMTPDGHALTWETPRAVLTEVTGHINRLLPRGEVFRHRVVGERSESVRLANGILYRMASQLEVLSPEEYVHVHDELLLDGLKRGILHRVYPHNRFAISPLGFVTVESFHRSVCINTWHTFPGDFAVAKTQSLIERE